MEAAGGEALATRERADTVACTPRDDIRRENAVQALAALAAAAAQHAERAVALRTAAAYRADWDDFVSWCRQYGLESLPAAPETIALYVTDRARRHRTSTLERRLVAIARAHRLAGYSLDLRQPAVREVVRGIKRRYRAAPAAKRALETEALRAMRPDPSMLLGIRDRALLLVGYVGAFRRAELVALDVEDLSFGPAGVAVTVRRSKEDQEGEGEIVGIPRGAVPETCPVRALLAWLDAAEIEEGAVFRRLSKRGRVLGRLSDKAVSRVVKQRAATIGIEPRTVGAHSLRSGFATAAAAAGADLAQIMQQTRHRSERAARRYVQAAVFRNRSVMVLGL